MVNLCTKCGEPISEARRRALPNATTCVGCSDEAKVHGFLSWDGKHSPRLQVLSADVPLPQARRSFNASIGTSSYSNPRIGQHVTSQNVSAPVLSPAEQGLSSVLAPHSAARCHPDRPRVTPGGHCLECAAAWYKKGRR